MYNVFTQERYAEFKQRFFPELNTAPFSKISLKFPKICSLYFISELREHIFGDGQENIKLISSDERMAIQLVNDSSYIEFLKRNGLYVTAVHSSKTFAAHALRNLKSVSDLEVVVGIIKFFPERKKGLFSIYKKNIERVSDLVKILVGNVCFCDEIKEFSGMIDSITAINMLARKNPCIIDILCDNNSISRLISRGDEVDALIELQPARATKLLQNGQVKTVLQWACDDDLAQIMARTPKLSDFICGEIKVPKRFVHMHNLATAIKLIPKHALEILERENSHESNLDCLFRMPDTDFASLVIANPTATFILLETTSPHIKGKLIAKITTEDSWVVILAAAYSHVVIANELVCHPGFVSIFKENRGRNLSLVIFSNPALAEVLLDNEDYSCAIDSSEQLSILLRKHPALSSRLLEYIIKHDKEDLIDIVSFMLFSSNVPHEDPNKKILEKFLYMRVLLEKLSVGPKTEGSLLPRMNAEWNQEAFTRLLPSSLKQEGSSAYKCLPPF